MEHLDARWPRREGVLLVGHGSRGWPDGMLLAMAERLAGESLDVGVAVLRGRPTPADALSTLAAGVVHVVPVLMAQGQMAAALRSRLPAHESARLVLHPTLGSSPGMEATVADLVNGALARNALNRDRTAVVLVGHGNARHPAAGAAIDRLADGLRSRGVVAAEIHSTFLEQPPAVEDWPILTRLPSVLVVPCFLSSGAHVREDLPRRLRTTVTRNVRTCMGRRLCLAPPLATATDGLIAMVRALVSGSAVQTADTKETRTLETCHESPPFEDPAVSNQRPSIG